MKLNRFGAAVGVLAAGALVLSACGNDDNVTGGGATTGQASAKVDCGGKKTLKASGSTAQANAMTRFVNVFEQACPGQTLNYTANGSGAGISEFNGNQTDFGGSDVPLSKDEAAAAQRRCGSPAWNLPVVFGPIAVTYNLNSVSSLNLDGPTLAKIFNGSITQWNNPAIQALNRDFTLPGERIHVVFRSDESGTTDNFQRYLQAASNGAWGKGAGKSFQGGVGEGARGNDGTSAAAKNTPGSITYNEWSFAQAQHLTMANIVTSGWGPGGDYYRLGRPDDRRGHHLRGGQRPGARHGLVLPAEASRLLSDRVSDIRNRLLEVSRLAGWHGCEGVPAEHYRRRSKRPGGQRIHPNSGRVQIEAVDCGQRDRLI